MSNKIINRKSFKFAPDVAQIFWRKAFARRFFLPLFSIELSDVCDDLKGPLHVVDVIEPAVDYLGSITTPHHTYYCRQNWMSLHLKWGRLRFDAPETFFNLAFFKTDEGKAWLREHISDDWSAVTDAYYARARKAYDEWRLMTPIAAIEKLHINFGGKPHADNWSVSGDFPVDIVESSNGDIYHYPLTEDGRRFRFIGTVQRLHSGSQIIIFYDPIKKRTLQTFDY